MVGKVRRQMLVAVCAAMLCIEGLFPKMIWNRDVCKVYDLESGLEIEDPDAEEISKVLLDRSDVQIRYRSGLKKLYTEIRQLFN